MFLPRARRLTTHLPKVKGELQTKGQIQRELVSFSEPYVHFQVFGGAESPGVHKPSSTYLLLPWLPVPESQRGLHT